MMVTRCWHHTWRTLTPFSSPEEQHSLDPKGTEAKKLKYIGYFYKGDPMEDLDYPDIPPPEECSHFTGRCVDMLSRNGVDLGPHMGYIPQDAHDGDSCQL